jgi:dTDP-glucose pyrophosphorylase
MQELGVILLAAGQGTRMKSALPKVLHPIAGRPLFLHALAMAQRLLPARVAIVIGHGAEAVRQAYHGAAVAWAIQDQQLGTGHAVLCAKEVFDGFAGEVLILSGDVPLIEEDTLRAMVEKHCSRQAAVTLLTAALDRPQGYGRVMRDASGRITGIVEEKDASDGQRQILEVNAGVYVASSAFLFDALGAVKNDNRQGEYYLPDIVAIGLAQGKTIETVQVADAREMMGEYWQDLTSPGCESTTERPTWENLYWTAELPAGTGLSSNVCTAESPQALENCTLLEVANVEGTTACSLDADCAQGFCAANGVCQVISSGTCVSTANCAGGSTCDTDTNTCVFDGQPVFAGAVLNIESGSLNSWAYLRMNIVLRANTTTNQGPVVHDWALTYTCYSVN